MSQLTPPPNRPRASSYTAGIMMMLMGGLVLAIGFGLIGNDPSKVNAPPWVIAVFGGMFILAGLWANLKQAMDQNTAGAGWINFLFALLVMLAISVICLWIGFGPGQRVFVHNSGNFHDKTSLLVDPTLGRIFFGLFGILMSGVTVAVAVLQGRKLLRGK
jgi:hypothetical protein